MTSQPRPDGRFVWISAELYDACKEAWYHSRPDAGRSEWAGDVASGYEDAPADAAEVLASAIYDYYGPMHPKWANAEPITRHQYRMRATVALLALGYPHTEQV